MDTSSKFVIIVGTLLLMGVSVAGFFVFSMLTEMHPLYDSQEFDVIGTMEEEQVEGTCKSDLSSQSGYGIMVIYKVHLKNVSKELDYFIMFDTEGKPTADVYTYDESQDEWHGHYKDTFYSFKTTGKNSIGSMRVVNDDISLSFTEVIK